MCRGTALTPAPLRTSSAQQQDAAHRPKIFVCRVLHLKCSAGIPVVRAPPPHVPAPRTSHIVAIRLPRVSPIKVVVMLSASRRTSFAQICRAPLPLISANAPSPLLSAAPRRVTPVLWTAPLVTRHALPPPQSRVPTVHVQQTATPVRVIGRHLFVAPPTGTATHRFFNARVPMQPNGAPLLPTTALRIATRFPRRATRPLQCAVRMANARRPCGTAPVWTLLSSPKYRLCLQRQRSTQASGCASLHT